MGEPGRRAFRLAGDECARRGHRPCGAGRGVDTRMEPALHPSRHWPVYRLRPTKRPFLRRALSLLSDVGVIHLVLQQGPA